MKLVSSHHNRWNVWPLMVSGLFGNASITEPFLKLIRVFWILQLPGGRLWQKPVTRRRFNLVWRQLGPTNPTFRSLFSTASCSISPPIKVLFPVCLGQRTAKNWFARYSLASSSWYLKSFRWQISVKKAAESPFAASALSHIDCW